MQKIVLIALLCATAFAVASTPTAPGSQSVGTADGFYVVTGVSQHCHRSCKTCNGPASTDCLSCLGTTVTLTAGACGCPTANTMSAAAGVPICELDSVSASGTATVALCNAVPGMWADMSATKKMCKWCDDKCKTCTTTAILCGASATGCWGTLANNAAAAGTACAYTTAKTNTWSDLEADQSTDTPGAVSAVKGYYYVTADKTYIACAKGCLTCTATAGETCKSCATGFTLNAGKTACECPAAGNFATAATLTALDKCETCQVGCVTCSSKTVCTLCDSSTHKLGATTASSSTCESLVSTDASTTTTTDGEKDGESTATTATDATSTNGVLLTAASMLLAVILA